MATVLIEGQWMYRVDEKGRFPLPPKIRSEFGKTWILAFDPVHRAVILFPFETWQKMVSEVENPVQFRLDWFPFQDNLDMQGRLTISRKLRELGELGHTIMVISLGDRLMLNAIAEKSYPGRN